MLDDDIRSYITVHGEPGSQDFQIQYLEAAQAEGVMLQLDRPLVRGYKPDGIHQIFTLDVPTSELTMTTLRSDNPEVRRITHPEEEV